MAKILIAEDDELTRYLLKSSLEHDNHNIAVVKNGREALEQLFIDQPDMILLDLMMPVMNGFEFIEKYRDEFKDLVPVVVITGADLDEKDRAFLSSETTRVLEKSTMSDTGIADELVKTIETISGKVTQ